MDRIAVKIGSNVLTRADGSLDHTRISALVDQVCELLDGGSEVIIISSGAVASGRDELGSAGRLDPVSQRQLFSAVGQVRLMHTYYQLFKERGHCCGQVLTTKENFSTRHHYLNQKNCMEVMLSQGVIPIVNENDTISLTELMFTDNDELAGLVATMPAAAVCTPNIQWPARWLRKGFRWPLRAASGTAYSPLWQAAAAPFPTLFSPPAKRPSLVSSNGLPTAADSPAAASR